MQKLIIIVHPSLAVAFDPQGLQGLFQGMAGAVGYILASGIVQGIAESSENSPSPKPSPNSKATGPKDAAAPRGLASLAVRELPLDFAPLARYI